MEEKNKEISINENKKALKPKLNQEIINNNLNKLGSLFLEVTTSMKNMQNISKQIQDEMNNLQEVYNKINELDNKLTSSLKINYVSKYDDIYKKIFRG